MTTLGRQYADGEMIVTQGESGECMYVIQEGEVEVFMHRDGRDIPIAVRRSGEFFGEMAIFEREKRSASVRARGPARVLTVDRKQLLSRIQDDPSLAYRLIQTLSSRLRELSDEVANLKSGKSPA
jgi:CRP-like cAMP-binding protein